MALGEQLFPALNWQPQFTVIATLSTIFVIVKNIYIIAIVIDCAINYSVSGYSVWVCRSTTEPSTTNKNHRSMFGTTKMKFYVTLPTSIHRYWCEENRMYNWVGCVSNYSSTG